MAVGRTKAMLEGGKVIGEVENEKEGGAVGGTDCQRREAGDDGRRRGRSLVKGRMAVRGSDMVHMLGERK